MNIYYKLILFLLPNMIFAEGIVIDFDKTIFIQLFIFLVFGIIIQKLIVNPVVDIIDKREEATVGSKDDSKDMLGRIEEISSDYENKLKSAKKEAFLVKEAATKELSASLFDKLASEKNIFDEKINEFAKKLEKEKIELKKDLNKESKVVADLIVKKVMG